jgi:hypothetical protein
MKPTAAVSSVVLLLAVQAWADDGLSVRRRQRIDDFQKRAIAGNSSHSASARNTWAVLM